MNKFIVDTHNITKKFGNFIAVNNVSFQIPKGSIFGFLGPNGSGKSTTIRMLLGIITPTSGQGSVLGYDIFKESEEIRARVGYMSQLFSLYRDLTVYENLDFFAGVFNLSGSLKKERINYLLETIKLKGYENEITENIPRGIRQRLSFAVSLIHDPQIIFLDEPTGGVDPSLRRYFWDIIAQLAQNGKTIMVTTHYMDEVERCDTICFIYDGKLIAKGSPQYLKKNIIKGNMYHIIAKNRIEALDIMKNIPQIINPFPAGQRIRFMVEKDKDSKENIKNILISSGLNFEGLGECPPNLEDVFISLVLKNKKEDVILI